MIFLVLKLFLGSSRDTEDISSNQITAIVSYSKGFACACGPGTVFLFEKTDDKDFFKKTREVKVRFLFAVTSVTLFTLSLTYPHSLRGKK